MTVEFGEIKYNSMFVSYININFILIEADPAAEISIEQ